MSQEIDLLEALDEGFKFKLFGKKVNGIAVTSEYKGTLNRTGEKLILVKVYGLQLSDNCIKLPVPFYTFLPDDGVMQNSCSALGHPEEYLMWIVLKTQEIAILSFQTDTADKVLTDFSLLVNVDADFHIHDVSVSGTSVSGKLRAYLHLRQPGPFGNIFDITPINGDYSFSVNLSPNTCITVFTYAIASAQICFRADPNRICGSVNVGIDLPVIGHWGKTFDIACVNI